MNKENQKIWDDIWKDIWKDIHSRGFRKFERWEFTKITEKITGGKK